jgi:hypothetical protein
MVHIAVLIMVKNEKKRLNVTLESIKNFADSLVIFDTGSTDNTIEICKEFSKKNKIPLRLKEGEFVNFEVSRNESIDFAETFNDIDYILLLDTNDELRNGEMLRNILEENKIHTAFMLCQEWFSGVIDKYYNVRLIKARAKWRYVGSVHEYIKCFNEKGDEKNIARIEDKIVLYQDRTQDDYKSQKRFHRDEELLIEEYKKDKNNSRTIFYLAQTCLCLNKYEDALYYYKLRTELEGFKEEKYYSFYKCGIISFALKHSWHDSMSWFLKAYDCIKRAEPLVGITEYYYKNKQWDMAYIFINLACKLEYPNDCILFVNRLVYDYKRWNLMGIIAFYNGNYKEGKDALYKAIEGGKKNNIDVSLDKNNLKFYYDKDKELSKNNHENVKKEINKELSNKEKLVNIIKSKKSNRI